MLLLRYQRQRQAEGEDGFSGRKESSEHDMRRKINDRDLKGESHRAATRGTLICIFVCGFLLLSLGLTLLFVGLLVPGPKKNPTPWLVTGPTCIVLGILVLLLSVEIILKLRKISSSSRSSVESDAPPRKNNDVKQGWGGSPSTLDVKDGNKQAIPVIIQPPTPLQLDATTLPVEVVQHR